MPDPTLIILKGYPGTGKTTLAKAYAIEHDLAYLKQDVFEFDFNPAAVRTRPVSLYDNQIGFQNLLSVLANYMKTKRSILLEGALVAVDENSSVNLSDIITLAEKHRYHIILVTLTATEKVRRKRQRKRKNVLPLQLDRQLASLADLPCPLIESYRLDTTKLNKKQSLSAFHDIISQAHSAPHTR